MRSNAFPLILAIALMVPATILATDIGGSNLIDFQEDDFVGAWTGTYESTTFGGSFFELTIEAEADGSYTDSSGHLMPSLYPNTQQWEFDAETNRLHFWYLQTVYAGQHFYQHFFYEVVSYTGNEIEMHYNFWDDPEPHPEAGTIILTRAGVADAPQRDLPAVARLQPNFPNPFNPSTSLSFSLPREGHVSLKVYDARGREVASVFEGTLPEGQHSFQWTADGLPGGVYLYRLQAGDHSETRKMSLVK